MVNEAALLESRTLRASLADRTSVLDKVKSLSLMPDGLHVTKHMVAAYFEVGVRTIESLIHTNRSELEANGYHVLTGTELTFFKNVSSLDKRAGRHLALFTRRTVLNLAMLLRDSIVARQVRTYVLDTEERTPRSASPQAVDNSVVHSLLEWLSQQIEHSVTQQFERIASNVVPDEDCVRNICEDVVRAVIGTAVLPLLNEAIQGHTEVRRRLDDHQQEIVRLNRVLREHEAPGFRP